jgi:benzylsuccinate CoA-transferase BbsF subunit/naphthyl-2-methylsuccinate CoA transferase subunit
MVDEAGSLPLSGVRVIDLTVVWSGPGGTALLGDLGAEVIRVEDVHRSSRNISSKISRETVGKFRYHQSTFADGDPGDRPYDRCAVFNWHARNKLSVTMSLTDEAGRQAFLDLVAISDIVIENNSPGVMEKLGLDYETLRGRNDRIIVVRMPPLGMSGPLSNYLGYGPNFNSLVGIAAMDGYEGEDPTTAGENYHMDEAAPGGVAFAAMAALWDRERTGAGQMIEFPQAENLLLEMGEYLIDYQVNDRVPPIRGNSDPLLLQGVVATRDEDRWAVVSVRDEADWKALARVIGREELTFAGWRSRSAELLAAIEEWSRTQDAGTLMSVLQSEGVPASEVMSETRLLTDPQLASREWLQTRSHPAVGTHQYPGNAWRVADYQLAWGRPVPGFGEDNAYVYRELLGYSEERLQELIASGMVGTRQLG